MREPRSTLPPDPPEQTGRSLPTLDAQASGKDSWAPAPHLPAPHLDDDPLRPRRSLGSKMFEIGAWGWVKLALLCIVVGILLQVAQVNPFDPDFTVVGALGSLAQGVADLAGWSVANGWRPAIVGALVVVPLWLVWRLLSVPFRK